MKTRFFLSAVMAAGLLASCSNSEEVFNEKVTDGEHSGAQLNIVPTVSAESAETRAGFDPKTDWAVGDAMGLFMYKASGWGDAYPRYDAQNNKSTRQANSWSQASPVYLLVDKATIWAYYPYNQAVADGTKIPVPINVGTSVDYMWGKSTNQVSVIETDARIPMKHALSQFVVRLKVSPEYHNDGNLTSAKLKATASKFATTGTMNLNDGGKITFQPVTTELAWSPNTTVPAQGQQAVDYAAAIYPMTLAAGEVSLEVVIDGATYTYAIPQITWEAGKRYIYSITMRSNDAEIGGENGQSVTIEGWTSTEEDITLVPVK
ncbi:fimbrillin family protein [Bacteroides fragilis]|uniref:fimbrillin family protein n=1 Tax=Bacteroides fragilis TaxID=817 RepID=UPI001C7064F7|nr:fimbrillin family protein [Bacteroides fragilis]MBW9280289.1 fimbrillin family protein [Bacteroides fragilis]